VGTTNSSKSRRVSDSVVVMEKVENSLSRTFAQAPGF
jgi:hypothetical protein